MFFYSNLVPETIAPYIAAPADIASSGLSKQKGLNPLKYSFNNWRILGILVEPPTKMISFISVLSILEIARLF